MKIFNFFIYLLTIFLIINITDGDPEKVFICLVLINCLIVLTEIKEKIK